VRGLAKLPSDTVIDGELIALGDDGRPSFNALQNYGSASTPILYFIFDVMVFEGRDVKTETLDSRRKLLEQRIVPKLTESVRYVGTLDASLRDLVHSVKAQGLEGLVAKRRDSRYEPGLRSGAWMKMRGNQGQEFVIGGYTVGTKTFDALIFGYYEGDRLIYAARTRNGFTPAVRATVQEVPSARNRRMSVRESAGSEEWSMGPGLDEGKDGGLPMAEASNGRTVPVPGMDGRQSPSAHQIHRSAGGQECARCQTRIGGHGHRPEIESRSPSAPQRIHLLRTAFPVLPSLIDERPSNELNRVEFADREAVEPCLAFAAETPEPSAASVPLCDVDAVRAALAEEDDGHGELVYAWGEQNTKLGKDPEFCGGSIAGPQHFILLHLLRVREKLHQRLSDPR
jgi:hypothetical protein